MKFANLVHAEGPIKRMAKCRETHGVLTRDHRAVTCSRCLKLLRKALWVRA